MGDLPNPHRRITFFLLFRGGGVICGSLYVERRISLFLLLYITTAKAFALWMDETNLTCKWVYFALTFDL